MSYYLFTRKPTDLNKVPIAEKEYIALQEALNRLGAFAEIEEQWDCTLQNFIDLEEDLLREALRHMINPEIDLDIMHEAKLRFARRLANLLSACRSYLDHTPQKLAPFGPALSVEKFKILTEETYDSSKYYRFMEALRNYSQHNGLHVHATSYTRSLVPTNFENILDAKTRVQATGLIWLKPLQDSGKFKRKALEETSEAELDIKPYIREYISSLSDVHVKLRSSGQKSLDSCAAKVREHRDNYMEKHPNVTVGIYAGEFDSSGEIVYQFPVHLADLKRINKLSARNKSLSSLVTKYVSGEITDPSI